MSFLLTIGSAVAFYCAFPNIISSHGFSFLGWLFAIPFFCATQGKPVGQRLLHGFLWGLVAHGLLVQWFFSVTFWGAVFFVLVLSLQGVIFSVLMVSLRSRLWTLLYVPSAWVVSEWLRAKVMGGWVWSLAYSQSVHPSLIQLASFGGVDMVAAVMMFVNIALYFVVISVGDRWKFLIAAAVVFFLNLCYGIAVLVSPSSGEALYFKINTIQPNITRAVKTDLRFYDSNIQRHVVLTEESVLQRNPDLVIWPETAFVDDIFQDPVWARRMKELAERINVPVLFGSALLKDDKDVNAAVVVNPGSDIDEIYVKRRLVPFSEYRPQSAWARRIYAALGLRGYDFVSGKDPGVLSLPKEGVGAEPVGRLGVVICSEDGYPDLFRDLAKEGVGAVAVMLNDGWFLDPLALLLHAEQSVFRAVEFRFPVIRAANTGWSVAFDAYGRKLVTKAPDLQVPGVAYFDVPFSGGRTVYAKFGDFFVGACLVFVIIITSLTLIRKRLSHA